MKVSIEDYPVRHFSVKDAEGKHLISNIYDDRVQEFLSDAFEQQAAIDKLKADLFEAKREYKERQEWSANQSMLVIKSKQAEIDEYREMLARVMTYTVIPNSVTNEIDALLNNKHKGE